MSEAFEHPEQPQTGLLTRTPANRVSPATAETGAVAAAGRAHWFPATAETRMGGDVHAVRRSRYGIRLLIADVRGQGSAAAAGAAALLGAFGGAAEEAPTLEELVDTLEAAMVRYAEGRPDGGGVEDFATAVVAEVSPDGRTLRLIDRGHPAPLLLRPGAVRTLKPADPGPPLGLRELAPFGGDASLTLPFPPDATLLLLTDGTTEARNADGAFYDPVARLVPHAGAAPEVLVRRLRREVRAHVARRVGGRPADDMALLALAAAAAG